MSIVAKVLGRVLIERIVAGTDVESIREQGFRKRKEHNSTDLCTQEYRCAGS